MAGSHKHAYNVLKLGSTPRPSMRPFFPIMAGGDKRPLQYDEQRSTNKTRYRLRCSNNHSTE